MDQFEVEVLCYIPQGLIRVLKVPVTKIWFGNQGGNFFDGGSEGYQIERNMSSSDSVEAYYPSSDSVCPNLE